MIQLSYSTIGSNEDLEMHTETFKDGEHVKRCQENNDESGSSRFSDSSSAVIDGSGSGRHSKGVKPEIILESHNRNESSSHINSGGTKLKESTDLIGSAQKDEQNDLSSESSANSENDNSPPGCLSTSQVYDGILDLGMSPTSRPAVQVMNRSTEYDPCRIPASVFDIPNDLKEWSLASNESLFSIRLENISFSRKQAPGEIGKSVELNKSFDLNTSSPFSSCDLNTFSPFSPVTENTDKSRKSDGIEDLRKTKTADEVSKRVIEIQKDVKNTYPVISCSLSSVSSHPHGNGCTFIDKEERHGCYCNCSWPNCFCERPSCQCFNCCWAFCYCCSRCKGWHNHVISRANTKSFAEADAQRQISVKAPELNSNSTAKSHWWHCFSWPRSRCGNCWSCFSWPCSLCRNCYSCFSWPCSGCGNCWSCFSWPCSLCGNCYSCFSWPCSGCGNCWPCSGCGNCWSCTSWPCSGCGNCWSRCGNCCSYCHCC